MEASQRGRQGMMWLDLGGTDKDAEKTAETLGLDVEGDTAEDVKKTCSILDLEMECTVMPFIQIEG